MGMQPLRSNARHEAIKLIPTMAANKQVEAA